YKVTGVQTCALPIFVNGGRGSIHAEIRGKRRLEARLARLALERLEEPGLLAADVGAGADEGMEVEVDARAQQVLAEESGGVGLRERRLETRHRLAEELARSEEHTSELQSPCNL